MDFLDEIVVEIFAGKGGNGMASFRREKYVEFGGPSGGNGGNGGDIIFIGDEGMNTLHKLRYMRHIKAPNGENGKSKGMHGKNALPRYVGVPLGTIIYKQDTMEKLGEIIEHNDSIIIGKGGKGGRGNMSFATNKNPAPNIQENGDLGENFKVKLELKVLADVGLIGFPNVGKSTFISRISNQKPKIDSYPFTTLNPNLGMVNHYENDFVVADLPGLIEGASEGLGLGIKFLRHIERCRIFLHFIDVTSKDPYQDFLTIQDELKKYDEQLLNREMIIVVNKIDEASEEEIKSLVNKFKNFKVFEISALQNINTKPILDYISKLLPQIPKIEDDLVEYKVYELEEEPFTIEKEGEYFVVKGPLIEKLFNRIDFNNEVAIRRFARQLKKLGIDDNLRKKGVKHLDIVKVLDYEFEFYNE